MFKKLFLLSTVASLASRLSVRFFSPPWTSNATRTEWPSSEMAPPSLVSGDSTLRTCAVAARRPVLSVTKASNSGSVTVEGEGGQDTLSLASGLVLGNLVFGGTTESLTVQTGATVVDFTFDARPSIANRVHLYRPSAGQLTIVDETDAATSSFESVRAVVLMVVMGVVFILIRTFTELADQFIIGIWPFYALAVAGVFVLRRRRPDLERPYRTWGFPVVPLLFLGGALLLLGNYLVSETRAFALDVGLILLGIPAYLVWRRVRG